MDKLRATLETSVRDSRSAESDTVIATSVEAPGLRCYAKITRATEYPTLFVTVEQVGQALLYYKPLSGWWCCGRRQLWRAVASAVFPIFPVSVSLRVTESVSTLR